MRQQNNGFVLMIVLVYLQLLALINITNIKQLAVLKKQITLQERQYSLRSEVQNILKNIAAHNPADCAQESYPMRFLQTQPLLWWQSHGCAGVSASGQYYYFVIDMGRDECAGVADKNNKLSTAHYYRVTVMLDAMQMMLAQETMIFPDQVQPACTQQVRVVLAGEGMLRWL